MPGNGAYTLGDVRAPRIVIECDLCQRRGDWSTQRLLETHGPDISMPDLKFELITCKNIDTSNLTPCKAEYSKETRLSWQRR